MPLFFHYSMLEPEDIDVSEEMQQLNEKMRKAGLKSTPQRNEIARWVFRTHAHFTVDDLIDSFRVKGEKISPATAYRVVQMLLELGFIIEHDFGKDYKFYEHTPGHDHHDHIICNQCGRIVEFHDEELETLKQKISEKNGFNMTSHSLFLNGDCIELEQNKTCRYSKNPPEDAVS